MVFEQNIPFLSNPLYILEVDPLAKIQLKQVDCGPLLFHMRRDVDVVLC
jgi:hypothetical protein